MVKPKRTTLLAAVVASTVVTAAVGVAVAHAAAVGCAVRYAVPSEWQGGFNADVTITNLGDPVSSWRLTWSYASGQRVTQAWNATVTQDGAQVTAVNASYNGSIGTNGTASFGFNGSWNGSNPVPTSFALNGVTCTGSVNPGPTPTVTTPGPIPDWSPVGPLCDSSDVIEIGRYWIPNNQWGATGATGNQCIWSRGGPGNPLSWRTSYNWSGDPSSVKSYAAAILGWHWGWRRSNTGLPVQLAENRSVDTHWLFNVTSNGDSRMNVAYDMWFHPMANPGADDQPTDELMIWLYRSNASPAGTRQGTVTIAGTTWEVWRGHVGSWNVYSYVRTTNTTSATLDLRDFTNDVVSRGWMSSSKYLTSVQAGPEIFTGEGEVDTTSYSATVR